MLSFKLLCLPPELLVSVLDYLTECDLARCSQVCHTLNNAIQGSTLFRYKIELALTGMMDGASKRFSVAEKLAKLKEFSEAWTHLSFSWTRSIPNPGEFGCLTSGIYAVSRPSIPGAIDCYQVPSRIRDVQEKSWILENGIIDVPFSMFEIDRAQDLIVMVETSLTAFLDLHLRSLTHPDKPHPIAKRPTLSSLEFPEYCATTLYVQADVVGYMVHNSGQWESHLQVWNWKTGIKILHVCNAAFPFALTSFAFISENHVMLSLPDRLLVFEFEPSSETDITPLCNKGPILQLGLPDISDGALLVRSSFVAHNRVTMWTPPEQDAPFRTSGEHALFVVTQTLLRRNSESDFSVVFLVQASVIQSLLSKATGHARTQYHPWADWGVRGTRVLTFPLDTDLYIDVRGSKAMIAFMPDRDVRSLCVDIYEINERIWKRQSPLGALHDHDIITEPSTVQELGWFRQEIATSLPYRVTRTIVQTQFSIHEFEDRDAYRDCFLMEDGLAISHADESCQFYIL
ncbi:uncharacterized protein FIBRA_00496 [Fibroporia radiculosa]|uniref:F-box domain-containing protein n=1 Tax=Fibroporia radiculosa TaxID=599839 RepID=J4G0B6_9APHY|nr:uncharacterized protein FIBRA_00496 [Fibroporia radiculosa]CCL98498.1 predicted protein [Fibroporia radiculosa]